MALLFFYNMGNCPDEKIIKIFASIYLSGLINSYSHKIQNPGIDSTTRILPCAFHKEQVSSNIFYCTVCLYVLFSKDCIIFTFIDHFFQIGTGFNRTFGLRLFEITFGRVEIPLQQFQHASVVQRRTRLCISLSK